MENTMRERFAMIANWARRGTVLAAVAVSLSGVGARADGTDRQGIFVPRNGGIEGRLGASHIYVDTTAGGVLELVRGKWPNLQRVSRIEPRFSLRLPPATDPLTVKQGLDRNPAVIYLEEGSERMGVRVRYKLYDTGNGYRGHGMTETWAYPNGEVFVVCAASFEGMAKPYTDGGVKVKVAKATAVSFYTVASNVAERAVVTEAGTWIDCTDTGTMPILGTGSTEVGGAAVVTVTPFADESLPGRFALVNAGTENALALYWRSGKMQFNNFVYRSGGGSPTYYQWPSFLRQAYAGQGVRQLRSAPGGLCLDWLSDGVDPGPNPEFVAVFRLAAGVGAGGVASFVDDERDPLALAVEGGVVHGNQGGYNDQEGVYEVRKSGNPLRVTIPGDAVSGWVGLKIVGLTGYGGVWATLDGEAVTVQLSAEGGIADDPLAPIRQSPEGPADTAFVNVPVAGTARVLEVSEGAGVQLAYQRRDPLRNLACFSSRGDGQHAAFRFSLADGVLRNMRAHGRRDWALTENLMYWFAYCGFTPEQLLNELRGFAVTENGPEGAAFRYVGRNATGGAESDFEVRVPHASESMRLDVKARFTVRECWSYKGAQFFDVFPFRGVWPRDWWYDEVLWVAPDGRVKWLSTLDRTFGGDKDLVDMSGPMFLAMHASERGNMVMFVHRFEPAHPVDYVICGNYVDFHMTVRFPGADGSSALPTKGETVAMEYQLALWGDENTTREELIALGRESLRRGRLALGDE